MTGRPPSGPGTDARTAEAVADAVFADAAELATVPGIAYGLVRDGELVHVGGRGEATSGGSVPGPDTVFRIASMTKSFTAAAILLLRDEGRLRLDDPVTTFLPFANRIGAPDGPPITIRDLLTMTSGLATDDPWGDRLESIRARQFDALVAGGLSFCREPRTGFEYSNTGYALLGRVVDEVSGTTYQDFVRDRICAPLGLAATTFAAADVPSARLAEGFRIAAGVVRDVQPVVAPGVYSAMGGLHSTISDLARWIAGFLGSWSTDAPDHPVSRWSLREAQEAAVLVDVDEFRGVDAGACAVGYGYGLYVHEHRVLGRIVSHSGGYPGFGSHMRWHPGSGWGVVALGNATYAPMHVAAREVLARIVLQDAETYGGRPPVAVVPWPRTLAAMTIAEDLLCGRVTAVDPQWWSPNMDLDVPWPERADALSAVRDSIGAPRGGRADLAHATPARAAWTVTGDAGSARVELMMTPERSPRIQSLVVKRVLR